MREQAVISGSEYVKIDPKRSFQNGFTMTEILVVIVLVSTAAIFVTMSFQGLLRQNQSLSRHQKDAQAANEALEIFVADVRASRAVIELIPGQVTLWTDDLDSNGVAGILERVSYIFEPPNEAQSAPLIRRSFYEDREILNIADLQVGSDSAPPASRHIVINIAYGTLSDSRWIGTSVALRRDPNVHAQSR